MWKYNTPGIPDDLFIRVEEVPITKEEIRVIQLSKARLSKNQIVYDIGCGSGSVSIEASLLIKPSGKVFSIDVDPTAIELTKKNMEKFEVSNIELILGTALQKIPELPEADSIFIGGTGGDTVEIIKLCESKLKSGGRIVIAMILLETMVKVFESIEKMGFTSVDISQLTVSKSRKTSTGTMMVARNPVLILAATKI